MAFIRKLLFEIALKFGFYVTRVTPVNELLKLTTFFRPLAARNGMIRLGGPNDGGYLLPAGVSFSYLFSAGVDQDVAFEIDFKRKNPTAKIFLLDGSIEALPMAVQDSHFLSKFLGKAGKGLNEVTMQEWLEIAQPKEGGLVLSLDIEGGEWHLFAETPSEVWGKFDCIVLELHGLEQVFNPVFFRERVERLLSVFSEFQCIHAHVNNSGFICQVGSMAFPSICELTLVHSRTGIATSKFAEIPNKLDAKNVISRPDMSTRNAFGWRK